MSTATQHGTMLTAALDLAARGFRVFPLENGKKHPARRGWQKRATTDAAKVRALWECHPAANVGIATGAGLYVLDADGPAGLAAFAALGLPSTLTARSGRKDGGAHYFYRLPAGVTLTNASGATIARGVDGRGEGGLVRGAGSLHESGARYTWTSDVAMAELPAWLIDKLAARRSGVAVSMPSADELAVAQERFAGLAVGDRAELESETRERVTRATVGLAALPAGEGNGRGNKVHGYAISLGECVGAGALDLAAARAVITGALDAGTAALHERSIERGLARGIAEPLAVEPVSFGVVPNRCTNTRSYQPNGADSGQKTVVVVPARTYNDDDGSDSDVGEIVVVPPGAREQRNDENRFSGRRIDIAGELAKPPVPIPHRCVGLLADGVLTIVSGPGGTGKTWLLLALAHGVTTGETTAGIQCVRGPAMLIDGEMGKMLLIDRIRGSGIGADCIAYDAAGLDLAKPRDLADLEMIIGEHVPAGGFVGIDSLRQLMPSVSENDSDSMSTAVTGLKNVARNTGAAILLLHHEGWDAKRLRGSRAIADQADAVFSFHEVTGEDGQPSPLRRLTCHVPGGKVRFAREPDDMYMSLTETGLLVAGDRPQTKAVEYRGGIVSSLPQKSKTAAAVACGTTYSNPAWRAAWDTLAAEGAIVKTAAGWVAADPDRVLTSTEEPAI